MALTAEDMLWRYRRPPGGNPPLERELPPGIFVDPSVPDIWGRGYGGGLMSRTPVADWAGVGMDRSRPAAPARTGFESVNPDWIPILMRDVADSGAALSPWIGRNDQTELGNINRANEAERLDNQWKMAQLNMRREDAANAERRAAAREAQNIAGERYAAEQQARKEYDEAYFADREADRDARADEAEDKYWANKPTVAQVQAQRDAATSELIGKQRRAFEAGLAKYVANPKSKKLSEMGSEEYENLVGSIRAQVAAQTGADIHPSLTELFKDRSGKPPISLGNKWYEVGPPPGTPVTEQPWPSANRSQPAQQGQQPPRVEPLTKPDLAVVGQKMQAALDKAYSEGKDINVLKKRFAKWLRDRGAIPPPGWE